MWMKSHYLTNLYLGIFSAQKKQKIISNDPFHELEHTIVKQYPMFRYINRQIKMLRDILASPFMPVARLQFYDWNTILVYNSIRA